MRGKKSFLRLYLKGKKYSRFYLASFTKYDNDFIILHVFFLILRIDYNVNGALQQTKN